MTEYQAKSNNALTLEVTEGNKLIGKLTYQSWYKFNAAVEIAKRTTCNFEPKGFWGTTIELKDGGKLILTFKMNWKGEIVIQTYFNNIEAGYIFKHKGIFRESFILIDQEGIELIVMKPHFRWNKMNYEYQVTTSDGFDIFSNKEILLMTSLHCANYYMSMATGT